MKNIVPIISSFVAQQFPSFYREEGKTFIAFVESYFEWLESEGNAVYYARNLLNYKDIDTTIEQFIVHFKNEFLNGIQFETESNAQLFIKNSIDFQRAKGTKRSIDLFFQLIYGEDADVYYPSTDLFRTSDGQWIIPTYLEVSSSANISSFINQTVKGSLSGASAFVDRFVRRKAKGNYVNLFFISNIVGNFQTGETLYTGNGVADGNPFVTGSFNTFDVINSDGGFVLGEDVYFVSNTGAYAKGIVTGTRDASGLVNFSLGDGGYGYNSNSQVLVSNNVLQVGGLSNVTFNQFEMITQNILSITFHDATTTFTIGDSVFRYNANGVSVGSGKILSLSQPATISNGSMIVVQTSGNIQSTTATANLFSTGNVVSANTLTLVAQTATANVMAISANVSLSCFNFSGSFIAGETINQANATGTILSVSNSTINVTNSFGVFLSNVAVVGSLSNAVATVSNFTTKIGIIDVSNTFYSDPAAVIVGAKSGATGYVNTISQGHGANFQLSTNSTFSNIEVANVNTDFLSDYANVALNALAYGFPKSPGGNATSNTIGQQLTFSNVTFGIITDQSVVAIDPGTEYSEAPFVIVYERLAAARHLQDYLISYTAPTSAFLVGETVIQSNSSGGLVANGASGIVKSNSNNQLYLKRTLVSNSFSTANASISYMSGLTSGAIAQMTFVATANSLLSGLNAQITGNVVAQAGSPSTIAIQRSGFNYTDDETVVFYSAANPSLTGSGIVHLGKQGIGDGYYQTEGSEPSGTHKIRDNYYYQEFSYDIQTNVPFDKYSTMLKNVLHMAGKAVFGTFVSNEEVDSELTAIDNSIVIG